MLLSSCSLCWYGLWCWAVKLFSIKVYEHHRLARFPLKRLVVARGKSRSEKKKRNEFERMKNEGECHKKAGNFLLEEKGKKGGGGRMGDRNSQQWGHRIFYFYPPRRFHLQRAATSLLTQTTAPQNASHQTPVMIHMSVTRLPTGCIMLVDYQIGILATPPKGTGIHDYVAYKGSPPCPNNGSCDGCASPAGEVKCSVKIDPEDCSIDDGNLLESVTIQENVSKATRKTKWARGLLICAFVYSFG